MTLVPVACFTSNGVRSHAFAQPGLLSFLCTSMHWLVCVVFLAASQDSQSQDF